MKNSKNIQNDEEMLLLFFIFIDYYLQCLNILECRTVDPKGNLLKLRSSNLKR